MNPVPSTSRASTATSRQSQRASTVSVGFYKADSTNLPVTNEGMLVEYITSSENHNIAEIRGAKMMLSSRDSYLESAVGYVEVKRTAQGECVVRAKVTPEHKIAEKNYIVTVTLDEKDATIKEASCEGCAASAGGCKHSLVFLFWLCRKSNEPAPTSVECYWKKPKLASVRGVPLEAENVFKNSKKMKLAPKNPSILERFKEECKKRNIAEESLISLFINDKKPSYNLFDMTLEFVKQFQNFDFAFYKKELDSKITQQVIEEINFLTVNQVKSKMWHSMRQGRITASIIYEASKCQTDGSLVQRILGGYKIPETKAIKRGKALEEKVIKKVEEMINEKIHGSGLILINSIIGASPDGITNDFIVEVKCPINEKTMKNYVLNGAIEKKFASQMQIQMLAAKKSKGLFCIADPTFEINKKVHLYWLQYDPIVANNLVVEATKFWERFVYNKIIKSAM